MLRVDGYDNGISASVHNLIDEWKNRLVNENLARGNEGGSPNHYWIVKNMTGSLMEEMVGTWNHSRSLVLQEKTKILELDTILTHKDVMTAWKKLAMGLGTPMEGGSGNVSAVPTGSMNMS